MNQIFRNNKHGAWQEWNKPANLLIESFYLEGKKYGPRIEDDYGTTIKRMVSKEVKSHLGRAIEKLGEAITLANNGLKEPHLQETNLNTFPNLQEAKSEQSLKNKIPMAAIALIYIYRQLAKEHPGIAPENRKQIAASYGYTSKSSGRILERSFKTRLRMGERTIIKTDSMGWQQTLDRRADNIRIAIQELVDYPKAIEIAESELRKLTQ